jgi:hypothetical protein
MMRSPLARDRRRPPGFIQPCQPIVSLKAPTGPQWVHELKHDGFRIVVHKDGDDIRLWSRNGRDWSVEFAAITVAVIAAPTQEKTAPEGGSQVAVRLGSLKAAEAHGACLGRLNLLHHGLASPTCERIAAER